MDWVVETAKVLTKGLRLNYRVPACEFSAPLSVFRDAHCGINIGDC